MAHVSGLSDVWASGDAYEPYMGRWSRLEARDFLAWLAVPPGGRWLDFGSGTGSLSQVIVDVAYPVGVVGIDASAGYAAHARQRVADARVRFEVGDAGALPFPPATFDTSVSGLVLNFVPDPVAAFAEMARVTRPGGTVGVYIWDYPGKMALIRRFWDAAADLDPAAQDLDEGQRFAAICRPSVLGELAERVGLQAVEARAIDAPTVFRDFDDYWPPFLGGQGPAPGYAMALAPERRDASASAPASPPPPTGRCP